MQITDTDNTAALELVARIKGITVAELLAPTIADLANGSFIRGASREPVTPSYLAWLQDKAVEAETTRAALLAAEIGA